MPPPIQIAPRNDGGSVTNPADRRLHLVHAVAREMTHPAGSQIGPRVQHQLQFMLVHSGSMSVTLNDELEFTVPAGQVCLLLPGRSETIRMSPGRDVRQILVRGDLEDVSESMWDWLSTRRPTRQLSAAMTYLAREAAITEQTRLTAQGALVDALATALLWRFIAEFENYPSALPPIVESARLFIHKHVTEDIHLPDIASSASVTPAYLIRLFRAHLGTTPAQYLWERRITLGIELLTSTGLPIAEVAKRSGFKTSFHFARRIKEATGQSPLELRNKNWA